MQHFQHKKKASKQFFMGDGLLSHFQLQLCQKEPFWNIMGLLVTVSTGGFPPPFQTTIPTAPAFQPFGKFVLRVHHALSPAQHSGDQDTLTALSQISDPCPNLLLDLPMIPKVCSQDNRFCAWFDLPQHLFKTFRVLGTQTRSYWAHRFWWGHVIKSSWLGF